ncbi:MAG TPA: hypothetical protein VF142_16815, partial [Longimicrobium sp.]
GVALASEFHTKGKERDHDKYNKYVSARIKKWVKDNQGSLTLAQLAPTFKTELARLQEELRGRIAAAWAARQGIATLAEQDMATKGFTTRVIPSLDDFVKSWPL